MLPPLMQRPAAIAASVLLLLVACRPQVPVPVTTAPEPEKPVVSPIQRWSGVQSSVLSLVGENRYTAADALLQQFARESGRTAEGDRARWWRALLRADQRAGSGDVSVALSQMDSLLGETVVQEVRGEVMLVRRSMATIDSLRRMEVRRRTQATQLASERSDELRAARDSMAKLSAEIERLRRRLSAP